MTTAKTPETLEREALTVLVQWRGADRRAVVSKSDTDKRAEYQCRKSLRTAADALPKER